MPLHRRSTPDLVPALAAPDPVEPDVAQKLLTCPESGIDAPWWLVLEARASLALDRDERGGTYSLPEASEPVTELQQGV